MKAVWPRWDSNLQSGMPWTALWILAPKPWTLFDLSHMLNSLVNLHVEPSPTDIVKMPPSLWDFY